MNDITNNNQTLHKAIRLLPWYVTAKLSPEEATFLKEAFSLFPELQDELKTEQHIVQQVKNDHSILALPAVDSTEDRFEHVLTLLALEKNNLKISNNNTASHQAQENHLTQASPHPESKFKSFFSTLFSGGSFNTLQYASLAFMTVIGVTLLYSTIHQESIFYPATKQTTDSKNKADVTILLLGVNGKINDPQLLKVIRSANATVSAIPNKDGMYRVTVNKKLDSLKLKDLINKLTSNKELVWFAGEALN